MAAFIIYIIRWAVCLTLLYSLFGLLLKRETLHGTNRVVLLVILLGSMVLPVVQLETKAPNYVTQGREILESRILVEERIVKKEGDYWASDAEEEYARNISRITNTPVSIDHFLHGKGKWNWVKTLLLLIEIYVFGVVVAWLRYFWSLAMLIRLIHQGQRIKIEGLPKHVRAITHLDIKTPCSWMRWMILNPADVDVRPIIQHELSHIRLGHSWDMLLCEFTCRMLWCVPFAWMLRQDLRDVHEYQADQHVLSTGIKDEDYQLFLIRKATSTRLQPVVNALNQSPIKRRFKMMYRQPSRRWAALKAVYLLPLSALALMAFATPKLKEVVEMAVEKVEDVEELVQPEMPRAEVPDTQIEPEKKVEQQEEKVITDSPTEPESETKEEKPHGRELPSAYYQLGVQGQLPTFPGGASALRDYLREHVNAALQSGIMPTDEIVYVRFKVFLDGSIREVEVRSSVNEEIDRAAIQIVKEMPHWSPARDWEGKPTMWSYTLPIQFKSQ